MKRILLALVAVLMLGTGLQAQITKKGEVDLNLGIGVRGHYTSHFHLLVPPISASADFCIVDGLINNRAGVNIGPYIGNTLYRYKDHSFVETLNCLRMGVRGSFHFTPVKNLDTYAGVTNGIALRMYDYEIAEDEVRANYMFEGFIGVRYFFAPSIAVFAETGYGESWFTVGFSFKL